MGERMRDDHRKLKKYYDKFGLTLTQHEKLYDWIDREIKSWYNWPDTKRKSLEVAKNFRHFADNVISALDKLKTCDKIRERYREYLRDGGFEEKELLTKENIKYIYEEIQNSKFKIQKSKLKIQKSKLKKE